MLQVAVPKLVHLSASRFFALLSKELETNPYIGCATRRPSTGHHSVGPRFSIFDHHRMKDALSISRWR
jgi:hypothetical protein